MFERFTKKARAVVERAKSVAVDRQDAYIGSEHLLLALTGGESGLAVVLGAVGVSTSSVTEALADRAQRPAVITEEDVAVLREMGIDADAVLEQAREDSSAPTTSPERLSALTRLAKASRRGHAHPGAGGQIEGRALAVRPFTKSAKKVLENSLREALQLGDNYISTEHLLLGLLRTDCLALEVLTELGTDFDDLRTRAKQSRPGSA